MTEKQLEEISKSEISKSEYPKIRLSQLVKTVLELKSLAMYPNSTSLSRDKLYNRLTYLESQLVELKDVNVELERDWWKE